MNLPRFAASHARVLLRIGKPRQRILGHGKGHGRKKVPLWRRAGKAIGMHALFDGQFWSYRDAGGGTGLRLSSPACIRFCMAFAKSL
jgi:hypothetical protein